jgi:transcriptional regulator with XRE-family HTH domain
MESTSSFGRVLVEQRKKRGMSRSQLAQDAQLSYPYVSQLETGRRKPSRKAAAQLAAALGMNALDLEAAIPSDEDNPREIQRANAASRRLLTTVGDDPVAGESLAIRAMIAHPPEQRSADRDDLIGQMIDLLEEFDASERLDVLADVQKRAMQRMLDERPAR